MDNECLACFANKIQELMHECGLGESLTHADIVISTLLTARDEGPADRLIGLLCQEHAIASEAAMEEVREIRKEREKGTGKSN